MERKETEMIVLKDVDENNWRLGLTVSQEQQRFVSDSAKILARAYAYREHRSRAYVIYNDDVPVGMVMYYDCEELCAYDFSQLFIDERYQGHGFGKAAARLILDEMRNDGKYKKVILCYIDGNNAAENMYRSLGFYHTGERDGDEIIMEKILKS